MECAGNMRVEAQRLRQLVDAIREEQWAFEEENSISYDERTRCLCQCLPEIHNSCDLGGG